MFSLNSFWLPILAGTITGILSGFGIGGGTLLLVYLTVFANLEQTQAQGINLLYFLPAALFSLPSHIKNGYIVKPVLFPAILTGLVCAAGAAWIATGLDTALLRKLFGFFLILIGLTQLFGKQR